MVKKTYECNEPILGTSDMLCTCQAGKISVPAITCEDVTFWADVLHGVRCEPCTALVAAEPYGGRCDEYCESFRHICVGAADDAKNDCTVRKTYECNEPILGTSDMLCTCQAAGRLAFAG